MIVAGGIVAGIGFTVGATIRVSGRQPRCLGVVQHTSSLGQQRGSGIGERDAPLAAVEEPHTELVLELSNLLADCRLGDVPPLGGTPEVQLVRDRNEIPEVSEFHRLPVRG